MGDFRMIHNLKIENQYFERVLSGEKTFEIRYDDRGYQKDDDIILEEISSDKTGYSGRKIKAKVGYVCTYQQVRGHVVFSLLNVELLK
jgi:ASC-1-like (ASCH) protein